MTTRGVINSNFYQIVNVDVDGNPTDVKPEYIITSNNANYANYAGNAFSVDVGNVVGIGNIATINLDGDSSNILYGNGVFSAAPNVSNANSANFANYANFAGNAYSVDVGNVVGIGNIATINLDGNSGNILYGNGVFSAVPDVGNANSANFANYANFSGTAYSVSGANVSGEVANANYATFAGTAYSVDGANVVGTVANANYANFAGNAYSVDGANVVGEVANANYATFAGTAYSVSGSNVVGEVANANYASYSGNSYSVDGANVVGQVANALISGTVYSNNQPNITSVGALTDLVVSNNISASGNISAVYYNGNGAFLTGVGNFSAAKGYWGSFYSNVTQSATSNTSSYAVTLNNSDPSNNGVYISNNSRVNFTYAGTYNFQLGVQVVNSGPNPIESAIWLRKNGIDVIDSRGSFAVADKQSTIFGQNIVSWNYILELNAGDYLELYWYTEDFTHIQLEYLPAGTTPTTPASPSVIVTAMQVTNVQAATLSGPLTGNLIGNSFGLTGVSFVNITGNIQGDYFIGNGSGLTYVTGGNVVGQVANATIAGTVYTNAQPNITSVGTLTSLSVTGNITSGNANLGNLTTSNYFSGDGYLLTNITGANVTGTVADANNASYLGGTIAANYLLTTGTGSSLTAITGANVTGQVANALIAGTVYTNGQPNITSVGTLTTLDVTGNISTSNYFIGNGAFLTGISGAYSNSNVANYLPTFTGNLSAGNANLGNLTTSNYFSGVLGSGNTYIQIPSVTSGNMNFVANGVGTMSLIGSNVNVSGNVNTIGMFATGNISSGNATLGNLTTSNYFSGNGYLLTGVTSASANTANTVTNNNQPNITSVGTLTTLAVSGNVTASTLISNVATGTAPLVVTSTTVVANLNVAQANIATNIVPQADTSNATNQQVYFGATSNGQVKYDPSFTYNSNNNTLNVGNSITFGANITGPRFISNVATGTAPFTVTSTTTVANLSVANATYANTTSSATTAGTVTTNSQPNITSVGTLTSLSVTGNITSGNANLGNLTTSNYFSGNGYLLTGIIASSANTAITVTGNSQPNITSVGALSNLTVSGNINSNNIVVGNLVTANSFFATTQSTATSPGGSLSLTYLSPQNQRFTGSSIFDVVLPDPSTLTIGAVWYLNNDSSNNIVVKNFAGTTLYTVLPGANTKFIYTGSSNWDYHSYLPNSMSASSTTANLANLVIANYFSGNGSLLTGITSSGGNSNYANFAGQVIDATQSNITSVGNLSSLTVNGNITGSNNIALYGNGGALTANISVTNYYTTTTNAFNFGFAQSRGTRTSPANVVVGDDIFAFTTAVYTGNGAATWDGTPGWKTIFPIRSTITSQPTGSNVWYGSNIRFTTSNTSGNTTYVSTFDDGGNFTVPSSVISSNANLGNLTTSNYFTGNGSLLTSITGANVTGQVGNALIAGTVYTNNQPNITSVGTLTGLTSNGVIDFTNTSNVTLGAVGNIHISGGVNGYVLQTDGAANLSWVAQSGGGGGGGTDFVPSFLLGGM